MRAAIVGNFDGVHRGHAHLIARLRQEADTRSLKPAAITFTSHPLQLIDPARMPAQLTTPAERRRLLQNLGVEVISLPFTPDLRAMSASDFLHLIRRDFSVTLLLMGFNNRIGADRLCANTPRLADAASRAGITLCTAPELPDLRGVSSSAIRHALQRGQTTDAATMLGRPYAIEGTVIAGRRLGRTIGFPTANIKPDPAIAIPAPGVYLARAHGHTAVVNIGHRPTVEGRDDAPLSIEAHLLGFSGNLYGRTLRLEFGPRLRGEKRFDSLNELKIAIANDIKNANEQHF